ncbi:MAG: HPr kinase/phosphatase C-terminal domain-containing protein [Aquamicrobium sp.]|uniref:HPr kinase/phosphorylase n=1 Tax=Aquamicrobium sp. TaxID=1872579 RepID=UPI00349ED526|nr:HPr kinase/phosphatase C-terminal domain-containing protein [Aquamicrobium sp.]
MTASATQDAGRVNLHATAIVAGGSGVLIFGRSGAGKSSLALAVIERARLAGRFAALVADDRVWLSAVSGRLVAEVPAAIAGLVEIRGCGPVPSPCEPRAVVDRVVRLVEATDAPRVADEAATEAILGVSLPRLDLSEGESAGGARALLAWLDRPGGRLPSGPCP